MRILVRAGELRCRNDWGSDLWQLRDPGDQVLEVAMLDDRSKPREEGTAARRIPPPVDRVIQPAADHRNADPERHQLVSDDLNRELLRKAREQFRDRQTKPSYWSAQTEPETEPIVISNDVIPPGAQTAQRAIRTDDGLPIEANAPAPDRSALPDVYDPQTQLRRTDEPDTEESAPIYQVDDAWKLAANISETESAPVWDIPSSRPFSFDPDSARSEPDRQLTSDERSRPANPRRVQADTPARSQDPLRRATSQAHTRPARNDEIDTWASAPRGDIETDAPVADDLLDAWQDPIEDDRAPAPRWNAEAEAVDWDQEDDRLSDEADYLIGSASVDPNSVWAMLPKCCGTCKDFRPASDGKRGWCNNEFAFRHRRMVEADDRPCETSLGHWWIAADFAWQGDVDMDVYTEPTPLMDKWFGRTDADVVEAPAEIRRRRS